MRLIDADELKKWSEEIEYTFDGGIDINEFDRKLEHMPTVDAVPVIRCKDCKHWQCDDVDSYCDELGIFGTDMNSYCSYAKKGKK